MTLAQIATELTPRLIELGIAGAMLYWFAQDFTKRMRAVEESTDRLAKAILVSTLAMNHLDKAIKEPAQSLLDELNEKQSRKK